MIRKERETSMKSRLLARAKKASEKSAARTVRTNFERMAERCYNPRVPHDPSATAVELRGIPPSESAIARPDWPPVVLWIGRVTDVRIRSGQVAQVVERSPEKAGVGGSTPSLATIILKRLASFSVFSLARR